MGTTADKPESHTRVVVILLGVVVGMIIFLFVGLVPMYNLLCNLTGITGRTGGPYTQTSQQVDAQRVIKVQFLSHNNEGMPWDFYPETVSVEVHPGEPVTVFFKARNNSGKDMVGQAVPSVSPFEATNYFHKTECFCFSQQPLEAGEEKEMGVRFLVDLDAPDFIDTITLSYTMFDVTQMAANEGT
ncbi:cytochrome c oxidase assembly protein [Gynuella sp.]|uniref:cytochrome c oxidase assembly protein n=1 Tax=Gynuella sp. TaxID=2969146 RepID=UPI003D0FE423